MVMVFSLPFPSHQKTGDFKHVDVLFKTIEDLGSTPNMSTMENMGQKGPKSVSAIQAEVKQVRRQLQEINVVTIREYEREKKRAEAAEARVQELEAILKAQGESEVEDQSEEDENLE